MSGELVQYHDLLSEIKTRIRHAQLKAALSANREMLLLHWDIGRIIEHRQNIDGWGSGVIPRLARDIHIELPDIKGFSERNLKRMVRFFREYSFLAEIMPRAVAQLPDDTFPKKVPQVVVAVKSGRRKHKKYLPYAFTEQGAAVEMLARMEVVE